MDQFSDFNVSMYLEGSCVSCKGKYKKIDTKNFLLRIGVKEIPPLLFEYCPTCLAKIYLSTLDPKHQNNNTYTDFNSYQPKPAPQPKSVPTGFDVNANPAIQVSPLNSLTKWLAVIFSIVALLILTYSLLLKYVPQLSLPNFPFYPYVVGFSFLIFFIKLKRGADFVFLIVIVLNFFSPHFRNLFYSYFESPATKIMFTLFFVTSFVSLSNLFFVYFRDRFLPKWGTVYQNQFLIAMYKALIPTFFLYFAVMSPFLLGAIKPGGDPSVIVNNVQIDPIFDALTTLTKETADVEIARQYFNEGKEAASLGTMEELNKSIQFYQMAIELVPKFSTAYAEMAYSYGAINRIRRSVNRKDEEAKTFLNKAQVSLDAAKVQNPENYTIYAVASILDFQSGNKKASEANLARAMEMSGTSGKNERLLQAIAYNEKSEVESINYLITIKDKINPNSAELFNLLAVKYFKIGNLEKTKECAKRASLLSPKYDEPYFNLALTTKEKTERRSIYNKIIEMKSDYNIKAVLFKNLIEWQYALKIVFWVLFIIMFIRFFYLSYQLATGKAKPMKIQLFLLRSILLFTVIFGSFELYIHVINPVDSLTHLFPTSFPIF